MVCTSNKNACMKMKDNSATCTECIPGMVLVSGVCQSCPSNCNSCSYSNNQIVCSACQSSYFLSADKLSCTSCGTNCLQCTAANACTSCMNSTRTNNGACESCSVPYCQQCATNKQTCTQCLPQFFLYTPPNATLQTCQLCPPGCQNCQSSNGQKCDQCLPGFFQ